MDRDKKIVNTEEENRAINPSGNSSNPEDSVSQEPAHTVNTDTSESESGSTPPETAKSDAVNPTGDADLRSNLS